MPIILETTRLVLKEFSPDDAQNIYDLNCDSEVTKYLGGNIYNSVDDVVEFIKGYDQYEKYGQGRLSVFEKETGDFIGWCGLKYLEDKQFSDLGYRLLKKHWGKGYATEASIACVNYGFYTLN